MGPARVFPGQLSVSRSFGDPAAKFPLLGGKPGVITAIPEIRSFKISPDHDFIVLGSDGVFDTLSNKDIIHCVLATLNESREGKSVHEVCAAAVECVVKNSLMRKAADNVTVVMIAFKAFKDTVKQKNSASNCKDCKKSHKNLNGVKVLSASPCTGRKKPIGRRSNSPQHIAEKLHKRKRKLTI